MAQSCQSIEDLTMLSIQRVVKDFPWDRLPSQANLPKADVGTKRTTTFVDSTTVRLVGVELRAYRDRLLTSFPKFDPSISDRLLKMPRICMLLKLLGLQDHLLSFMEAEKADFSLPLELKTAQELMGPESANLLELEQHRASLRDFHPEKPNVFRKGEVIPLRTVKTLGYGGWAQVDCVENLVTGALLARKRFNLIRTLAKKLKESFEREITSLQKLNGHQHIIQYLYSYETEQSLNLLLSPVADCNLHEYLSSDDYDLGNRNDILFQSFGCLASAIGFMHQHKIRHKDVKSQNVLLFKQDGKTRVVVTDFGISFDFSSRNNSITEGATHKTRKYCAPEVGRDAARGRKSDVYSLGCIYLEIVTVLAGKSVDDLDEHLGGDANYYESQKEMTTWIDLLTEDADEATSFALQWCSAMIQRNAPDRPYIDQIIAQWSFQTEGQNDFRKRLFCDVCLSELRINNLITAEGLEDEGNESDKTDYGEYDEQSNDIMDLEEPRPKAIPMLTSHEQVDKRPSGSGGYRTISVHVVYTTKLFESCIRAFHAITKSLRSSSSLPTGSEVAIIRLEMEYLRLVNWSAVVGLSGNRQLSLDLYDNRHAVLNILLQQQTILKNSWKNSRRVDTMNLIRPGYGFVSPKLPNSTLAVIASIPPLEKAEELANRKMNASPVLTTTELDSLIHQLTTKNDDLVALLSESGKDDLIAKEEETNTEILQLYSSFNELAALSAAVRPSATPIDPKKEWLSPDDINEIEGTTFATSAKKNLAQYARLKAINSFSETTNDDRVFGENAPSMTSAQESGDSSKSDVLNAVPTSTEHDGLRIQTLQLMPTAADMETNARIVPGSPLALEPDRRRVFLEDSDKDWDFLEEEYRLEAMYRPSEGQEQRVWIEWKQYADWNFQAGPTSHELSRILALANLLHDRQRPQELRVPHCLGLFQDIDPETGDDYGRFGLVFKRPEDVHPSEPITSLLNVFKNDEYQPLPLETRIDLARTIAEAVGRLHAVNWLHKGLRSDNVVLWKQSTQGEEREIDWSHSYISGFEYSRPMLSDELTERPLENVSRDIYRHPSVQMTGGRSEAYKKSYDIYSLGIILLEIAYWKPIDNILDIDLDRARPKDTWKVRDRLLSESPIREHVRFSCGVKFADAIWACLGGVEAFGIPPESNEARAEVGAQLQTSYNDLVVRKLTDLAKALG